MARISVEQKALTDPRFELLGRSLRSNRHEALGRMILIWNECQERGSYVLPREIIGAILGDRDGAQWLLDADLAVEIEPMTNQPRTNDEPTWVPDGNQRRTNIGSANKPMLVNEIRIRGTEGRIEWLGAKRSTASTNGKKGGRKPRTEPNQSRTNDEPMTNLHGFRQETPPAPAPALVLNRERAEPKNGHTNDNTMIAGDDVHLSAADREKCWQQFYFAYPNSTKDHLEAKLSWDLIPMTANLFKSIMAGLSAWRRSPRWRDPSYIHDAKNWLAKELWKVKPPPARAPKESENGDTKPAGPLTPEERARYKAMQEAAKGD